MLGAIENCCQIPNGSFGSVDRHGEKAGPERCRVALETFSGATRPCVDTCTLRVDQISTKSGQRVQGRTPTDYVSYRCASFRRVWARDVSETRDTVKRDKKDIHDGTIIPLPTLFRNMKHAYNIRVVHKKKQERN